MQAINDEDFKRRYAEEGAQLFATRIGVNSSAVHSRASKLRAKGVDIPTRSKQERIQQDTGAHAPRLNVRIEDGVVVVFSDAHYWPGPPSTAHRALVKTVHEMAPKAIICNGDAVDMAAVSRHPPIGWEKQPTVQEEIEAAQDRLHELVAACTARTRLVWNLGNHDARFETKLAAVAPQYAKVAGIHLCDHFSQWDRAWATWINDDVVVKHRFKGGDHATFNNTVKAGKTMVTGHLHSAQVRPFTDYNGTRFGVDTGCLSDPFGPQFTNYTEDNPRNWISAFSILTFAKGKLLWPELVTVWNNDTVQFRGKLISV